MLLVRFNEMLLPAFVASEEARKEVVGPDATPDTLRSVASAEFMHTLMRPGEATRPPRSEDGRE